MGMVHSFTARSTLHHWRGGRLTHPIFILVLILFWQSFIARFDPKAPKNVYWGSNRQNSNSSGIFHLIEQFSLRVTPRGMLRLTPSDEFLVGCTFFRCNIFTMLCILIDHGILKTLIFFLKRHFKCGLTLSWRSSLSYKNQSIDLPCKSMD